MHRIDRALFTGTWLLASAMVGCGSTTAVVPSGPGLEPPPAAPTPPAEPPSAEEPPVAAPLQELVAHSLPGATVGNVAPAEHGGTASVRWGSLRLQIAYREGAQGVFLAAGEASSADEVLEAAAFLRELEEAGVVLSRSTRWLATADGALECELDPEADSPRGRCRPATEEAAVEVTLDPPAWSIPPPRRPRSRPPRVPRPPAWSESASPAIAAIAEVVGRHPALHVTGAPLDASHQLVLVTGEGGVLLCIASRDPSAAPALDCTTSAVDGLARVASTLPGGWLLVAESSYGSLRDGSRLLAALTTAAGGPIVDTLSLGNVSGEGEACEDGSGYCVYVEGVGHRARLVSATCVEIAPGEPWRAVHHRVGDRWTDVEIEPASGETERYDVSSGRFQRGSCEAAGAVRDRE